MSDVNERDEALNRLLRRVDRSVIAALDAAIDLDAGLAHLRTLAASETAPARDDTIASRRPRAASTTGLANTEKDLVRRAVHSDADATTALLAPIQPGIVRYCQMHLDKVSGNYTTADDVSQEVCLAVLQALPKYQDVGQPFSAFVYGIAANKIREAQRVALRHATVPIEALYDRPDSAPGPEQQTVAADISRRLSTLLRQLSEVHREIIVLRIAVGLSAEEVGARLGMTPGAVRVAQSLALAHLRKLAPEQSLVPEFESLG